MNKDIITIYDNDNLPKEYKLLMVIDNEFKYIVYTDTENDNLNKNIFVTKIQDFNSNETLSITDDELNMVNNKYQEIINN